MITESSHSYLQSSLVVHSVNCIPYEVNQNVLNLSAVTNEGDGIFISPLNSDAPSLYPISMNRDCLLHQFGDQVVTWMATLVKKPNA